MNLKDPLSRVLYVDLTEKKFWVEDRREVFEEYLGGVGVAIKLLEEELPKNAEPLSPDNVIIFAVGPLTGVYPLASKTVSVFKSPLTRNLGESHAGGRSATALRLAGYGALVIKGASERPVYIVVKKDKVYFRDASTLWGMRSSHTVGRVIREAEGGAGIRSIMRIGRAGENLVHYASVITETYRHFGRLGLGAVFGSKKLKAIVVWGKMSIPIADPKTYREVYEEVYALAVKSELMRKYHDLGTSMNVLPLNKLKALPTKNLTSGEFEGAEDVCGEKMAAKFLARRVACSNCPVACIHVASLREPYIDEPYFYKTTFISYDYEPIYSLGSMLGVSDPEGLLKLMDIVEVLGLDAISTGVVLAWTTEALERGIISIDDTLVKLKWGDYNSYIKAVRYIVSQPNEFYKSLARGVEYTAKKYGGEEYALSYGGNEMPGYHTGPAAHIGCAIGARHSHLDNAGYSLDQKLLARASKTLEPEELIDKLVEEECWRQVLSSLVVCFFARNIYRPQLVSKTLKPLGIGLTREELEELGKKIYVEKYRLKTREGFKPSDLKVPRRVLEVPTPSGALSRDYIERALKYFAVKIGKLLDSYVT